MTDDRLVLEPAAPTASERRAIVERARRRGFRRFVLPAREVPDRLADDVWIREATALRPAKGGPPVRIRVVADARSLERALEDGVRAGAVLLTWTHDRVIPLENAVATHRGRLTIWTAVDSAERVSAALGALERGADRVVVPVRSVVEVDRLEHQLDAGARHDLPWATPAVSAVEPAGLGDRVLVDTTSLLAPDEGLLVGSSAAFLFLVLSEAVGSRFTRPRPFRVNAGAAHSYVLRPDGSTRYLSELASGDPLLAVRTDGRCRTVRAGRLKIERRPLVRVETAVGATPRTIFLQEAETVRLAGARGPLATTSVKPGDRVRGVTLPAARHLGIAVDESIEER